MESRALSSTRGWWGFIYRCLDAEVEAVAITYYAQILRWDWKDIVRRSRSAAYHRAVACTDDCDGDGHVGSTFLGREASLMPSGKSYTPETTHQTADDVERDARWFAALERASKRVDGYLDHLDGHESDEIFFSRYWSKAQLD